MGHVQTYGPRGDAATPPAPQQRTIEVAIYDDLPDPGTLASGTIGLVLDDQDQALMGAHLVHGPVNGLGEFWRTL